MTEAWKGAREREAVREEEGEKEQGKRMWWRRSACTQGTGGRSKDCAEAGKWTEDHGPGAEAQQSRERQGPVGKRRARGQDGSEKGSPEVRGSWEV